MDRVLQHAYTRRALEALRARKKTIAVVAALFLLARLNKHWSRQARNLAADTYDWSKEIVLVTGGSSGIGERLVKSLAARGIRVVVLDISPIPYAKPVNVHFFQCDITSKENVQAVGKQVRESVGSPTILVNNAGVVRNASILEKTIKDIEFTLSVNCYAHFWLVQEFLPAMLEARHGHIVTISSLASFLSTPLVADYNMSKAAATSFHETLGAELKHVYKCLEIRTSVVHPSYVATPLHSENAFGSKENPLLKSALTSDEVASKIEEIILSGEGRTIMIPSNLSMLGGSRGMPEWLFRRIMDSSAIASLT